MNMIYHSSCLLSTSIFRSIYSIGPFLFSVPFPILSRPAPKNNKETVWRRGIHEHTQKISRLERQEQLKIAGLVTQLRAQWKPPARLHPVRRNCSNIHFVQLQGWDCATLWPPKRQGCPTGWPSLRTFLLLISENKPRRDTSGYSCRAANILLTQTLLKIPAKKRPSWSVLLYVIRIPPSPIPSHIGTVRRQVEISPR